MTRAVTLSDLRRAAQVAREAGAPILLLMLGDAHPPVMLEAGEIPI